MGLINRANRYFCGDYQEVAIVPVLEDEIKRKSRAKDKVTEYLTRPEQQVINNKNTFRWMRLALQGNFGKGDYLFTLTFDHGELPPPEKVEEAKKILTGIFLRKVREKYKKKDSALKYIWVMEYELDQEGRYMKRVHFHIVINRTDGISRDDIEACWSKGRGKKNKILGAVNTKRLISFEGNGLEALAEYLSKGKRWKKGKKQWNSSRNLERPKKRKRDRIFSNRQMAKMATSNDLGMEIIAKRYPNHYITAIKYRYTEYRGWHMYLRMWKRERAG
ncbi:rolling circle replication-associated protein [Enterococcus rotai]|uniref:rolling circle replication-associated protein n=1 Tax=Enterococcus rotai TaxID=118060 RepID=UPI0035C710DB